MHTWQSTFHPSNPKGEPETGHSPKRMELALIPLCGIIYVPKRVKISLIPLEGIRYDQTRAQPTLIPHCNNASPHIYPLSPA